MGMLASRLQLPRGAVYQKNILKTVVVVVKEASPLAIDINQIFAQLVPVDNLVGQSGLARDIGKGEAVGAMIGSRRRRVDLPRRIAHQDSDGDEKADPAHPVLTLKDLILKEKTSLHRRAPWMGGLYNQRRVRERREFFGQSLQRSSLRSQRVPAGMGAPGPLA